MDHRGALLERERAEAGYMILLVPGELSPNRGERASGKRALAWHVRSTDNVDTRVLIREITWAREAAWMEPLRAIDRGAWTVCIVKRQHAASRQAGRSVVTGERPDETMRIE